MKWNKPLPAALTYSTTKIAIVTLMTYFYEKPTEDAVITIFSLVILFVIYLGVSWTIATIYRKHRGKTWAHLTCALLAMPLIIV